MLGSWVVELWSQTLTLTSVAPPPFLLLHHKVQVWLCVKNLTSRDFVSVVNDWHHFPEAPYFHHSKQHHAFSMGFSFDMSGSGVKLQGHVGLYVIVVHLLTLRIFYQQEMLHMVEQIDVFLLLVGTTLRHIVQQAETWSLSDLRDLNYVYTTKLIFPLLSIFCLLFLCLRKLIQSHLHYKNGHSIFG